MDWCVLSLDVSAASTGWAIMGNKAGDYGVIKTSPKFNRSERLLLFRNELIALIITYKPTAIVIEDTFSGLNPKTLKILAEFAGVAKETCQEFARIDPYVVSTNTVKAYFKTKTKEDMFDAVVEILDFDTDKWSFKKDNDIIDAIAMAMCYTDSVLELRVFKEEKDYGFLYNKTGKGVRDGKKH